MIILEKTVRGVSAVSLERFTRRAQKLAKLSGEVNVLISGDRRLQELNRRFRKKDFSTDVLSFPGASGGDIAISAEMARRNAGKFGHSTGDEVRILILHGMLHLAGYDHEIDNGRMARLEARLREQLKLPASLIERAWSPKSGPGRSGKALSRRRAR